MTTEILQRQDDCKCDGAPVDVIAGDLIRVREGVWRVMEVRTFARGAPVPTRVLKLLGADAVNRWQPCTLLEPFDRPRRVEAVRAPRVVSRARWMRTCAALVAASPPSGCPATIADAQVTLLPHQIDPVLAVLGGRASRLLLADAVGLGKTIQAALLVRELRARGCADRVLVLVPSGLREQWRQELAHRTGLRADIIDAAALAARTRDLPPDVNPWSLPGILIVSLDFIKQPSVLRGASTIVWDILIADEAHNLNEGTDRLAAADLLARHSRHVVLLTATPHHGSDDAFATLCRIGRVGGIGRMGRIGHVGRIGRVDHISSPGHIDADVDPIAIFRRTRQTMGLARTRRVHVLRVTPTKQERRLHALLARYAARVERECGSLDGAFDEVVPPVAAAVGARTAIAGSIDVSGEASRPTRAMPLASRVACDGSRAASLAMSILLKRASSSAWSLERSLRRRLALLDGRASTAPDDPPETQRILPFSDGQGEGDNDNDGVGGVADDDHVADGEPAQVLGAPGLRSARLERAWLTLLIEASRNASRAESKPRALARLLRRLREPALIYTEYRDTLTHFARLLASPSPLAMLHGGLGADDRRAALARFTSGDARVLLTTDAAGEGLNLHHRCRLVINVELPWNPNRLEQRIGRVDRLGQTRTVHAIHLVAADTAEEPMLARLTGRIAQIAATLGDAPAILRAREFAVPDAGQTQAADASIATDESDGRSYRSVSAEAADVVVQLQRLRSMRTRAWRVGRHRAKGAPASRGDPLLALDERAPLITVIRRRMRGTRTRVEQAAAIAGAHHCLLGDAIAAQRPRASPSTQPGVSGAPELSAPGLICVWRTQVERCDGEAHVRAGPPLHVLTVMHVACDVPTFTCHKAAAAFVTSTLDQCSARTKRLLDSELAAARERLHAADHPRIERLAKRDDAITAEMAAMLHARAASGGMFQPLLFEDIAVEKRTTGMTDVRYRTRAPVSFDAADAMDATTRVESTLVMAVVVR